MLAWLILEQSEHYKGNQKEINTKLSHKEKCSFEVLCLHIQETMTKVKFERIISFSSEHPNHKAENLISGLPSTSGSKRVG